MSNEKIKQASRPKGKLHFLGTHLTFKQHREFAIRAANLGVTKSGLLRALAIAEIEKRFAPEPIEAGKGE